jgi:hypothetical protein
MAPAPINMAQSGAQFTSFCRKLPMILCKKTGGLPVLNGLVFCVEFVVMRTANCGDRAIFTKPAITQKQLIIPRC